MLEKDAEFEDIAQAQLNRELQMNAEGIKDLKKVTRSAEERQYASHTLYGDFARREYTLQIAKELRSKFSKLTRGKAMEGAAALVALKEHLNWDRVAYISLSTMLDCAGVPKKYGRITDATRKEKQLLSTSQLHFLLARRLAFEANLQHIRKEFRHLYQGMKEEFFTEHAGYEQRATNIKRRVKELREYFQRIARGDVNGAKLTNSQATEIAERMEWISWSHSEQVQIGSLVARVVNDITGMFSYTRSFNENGKTHNIFVYSKVFDEIRDSMLRQAENFAWFDLPMLIPPKDWSLDAVGGYQYSARARYDSIVRGYRKGTEISQLTLDFINNQQSVAFCLDQDILSIQEHLADKGWTVLGENEKDDETQDSWRPYKAPESWDIPKLPTKLVAVKKPRKDATQEHIDLYAEKKAELKRIKVFHDRQLELQQLGRPVNRYLRLLRFIKNDPFFYFPWSLDWRGRCYPMVQAFNPQGPEYQKSVLNFAEETPVDDRTEFWLCVGIASAAGYDKESFETRVAWTKTNLKLVKSVANEPLGRGFSIWRDMPEPWIFLRACLEWKRIYEDGQTFTNIGCLGQDATQSGLQLLGGMVLDKQTCDLVNCVPGHDKPQDAYGTVLGEAIKLMEEDPEGSFPTAKIKGRRKLVKTPVMTKVYAAGHGTRLGQIRKALIKEGIRLARSQEENEKLIEYFTLKVEQAMLNTIPGVDLILEWFQRVVTTAIERGVEDIVYQTASGNKIVVEYRKPLTKQVTTESLGEGICTRVGSTKYERALITTGRGETEVDDVTRAVAANFTHGAGDAALLQLAFHDIENPVFTTTHDCVYAPPSRLVDENHKRLREAFITICTSNTLEKFAAMNKCPDIKPPMVNTYDPETVRQARYFFC